MKRIFSILGVAAMIAFGCFACSDSTNPGGEEWSEFNSNLYRIVEPADSLVKVKIPVLHSPSYEAKWGKPKIQVSAMGDYELSYANPAQPFDRLVIFGSVKPYPKLDKAPEVSGEKMVKGELTGVTYPQDFRTAVIGGQSVKWFQESTSGGADGAYFSTEGFALKDAFGKTGYYRMVVEAGDKVDQEVKRRFESGRMK